MADVTVKKKQTRKPRLSEIERKRRVDARRFAHARTRIYLDSEHRRWCQIKEEQGLKSDREVATFLIDSYKHSLIKTEVEQTPDKPADVLSSSGLSKSTPSTKTYILVIKRPSASQTSTASTESREERDNSKDEDEPD